MGIGYIMKSTTVILMATGAGKRGIVEKAFCGPVTPKVPASILQLHPNIVFIKIIKSLKMLLYEYKIKEQ